MSYAETTGRAYCKAIGADPDEVVKGIWNPEAVPGVEMVTAPRWTWYGGARVNEIVVTPKRRKVKK